MTEFGVPGIYFDDDSGGRHQLEPEIRAPKIGVDHPAPL
jgi:hypothetical protein